MALQIVPGTTYQVIDGFGVGLQYTPALSDAYADRLFTTINPDGLGLTRAIIPGRTAENGVFGSWMPNTTMMTEAEAHTVAIVNAQKAYQRGARMHAVFAEAPQAWLYDPRNAGQEPTPDGSGRYKGFLRTSYWSDYANRVASLASELAGYGVPLEAVSPFNEPDGQINVGLWSSTETGIYIGSSTLPVFVRDTLWPLMQQQAPGVRISIPASSYFTRLFGWADKFWYAGFPQALLDKLLVAVHGYDQEGFVLTGAKDRGIPVVQTEVFDNHLGSNPYGGSSPLSLQPGIDAGLQIARYLHGHLTVARVNQWHFFLAQPDAQVIEMSESTPSAGGAANFGLLGGGGEETKKLPALGQFSRFIRPGSVLVESSGAPANVYASAYRLPDGFFAVVAINMNAVATTLDVQGVSSGVIAVPYITDAGRSLAQQNAVAVSGGTFSYSLPPQSITTLVTLGLSASAGPMTGGSVTLSGRKLPGTLVTVT